tara:strand:- start:2730 stop:3233 length:504 start_codon:yes stop_codon:yes gene_type:complete
MKQLLLIRHGKSSWDSASTADHDRPLNERGLQDAPATAKALRGKGVSPDGIYSSAALRAATTAKLVAEGLDYPTDQISYGDALYLASPGTLLRIIQQFDEGHNVVMMFGHNPGMHEVVNLLAQGDLVDSFPTLSVARLDLDIAFWGEAGPGCASLNELITPRLLKQQ